MLSVYIFHDHRQQMYDETKKFWHIRTFPTHAVEASLVLKSYTHWASHVGVNMNVIGYSIKLTQAHGRRALAAPSATGRTITGCLHYRVHTWPSLGHRLCADCDSALIANDEFRQQLHNSYHQQLRHNLESPMTRLRRGPLHTGLCIAGRTSGKCGRRHHSSWHPAERCS